MITGAISLQASWERDFFLKNMNTEKEEITVSIPAEFAENLRTVARVFQIDDLGHALDYFAAFIFHDILRDGDMKQELENFEFQSLEQVDDVVTAAAEFDAWLGTTLRAVGPWENGSLAVRFGPHCIEELPGS
jgi:hypothetical protein